jgi:phosphomannomutase
MNRMSNGAPMFRGRRPTVLGFGTSGLRGLVTDITDLEAYINTRGFLDYLFRVGDAASGDTVCIAGDLRPSTDGDDRSIMRVVARAIQDAGLKVDNLGKLPTPALTYFALQMNQPSVMVTGSHIPFDRNGIKFNRRSGEVLKEDEPGILAAVAEVREQEYKRPVGESLFDDQGMFKEGVSPLPPVNERAREAYRERYLTFFPTRGLQGKRIVFFQHSAVGRDLLVELMRELGAEVHPAGRADEFVAIDTEDITDERLQTMQGLIDEVSERHGPVDALVSTDGDSDRPLLVGVDSHGKARFVGGDLLGIVVADYLGADCVTVPISANDALDRHLEARGIPPTRKTRIGSPWVIKGMQEALAEGRGTVVVGWEGNGGFMTGTPIEKGGHRLEPLPTRDAALPLLSALSATVEEDCSLVDLFEQLPPRFSKAGLLDQFPQEAAHALIWRFSPPDGVEQVDFEESSATFVYSDGHTARASDAETQKQGMIRDELETFFKPSRGFGEIVRINVIDGLRVYFENGDIAHIRPSGNAPQLRIYAVADTQARADEIAAMGIKEPDGLLRQIEAAHRGGAG